MAIQHVGIVAKAKSPLAAEGVRSLDEWLNNRGIDSLVDSESATVAGISSNLTRADLAEKSDLIVVLGGDGTFLSVARMMEGRPAPILGINLGSLGFLTEFAYDEMFLALELALKEELPYEDRKMIDVSILREGKHIASHAVLNDLVINRGTLARMLSVRVFADGTFVNEYIADGLIISTPTGSTAYNLSAGGPIVYPSLNALVVSPICPHTLTNRPIVIPDDVELKLTLTPDYEDEARVTLDGQVGLQVSHKDTLVAKRSKNIARIIQSPYKNYYQLLRGKLKWGETIQREQP